MPIMIKAWWWWWSFLACMQPLSYCSRRNYGWIVFQIMLTEILVLRFWIDDDGWGQPMTMALSRPFALQCCK